MHITLDQANKLSLNILRNLGIEHEEAALITENLIDAELANKKTHGLVRLIGFNQAKSTATLNTDQLDLTIISESNSHLHLDGKGKLGFGVIYKSLAKAFDIIKKTKLLAVGIKNIGVSGFIGSYARKATEKNLIFLGFNNSKSALIPYGTIKAMWGTNPLTVGIPTNDIPVILDMASSQITKGDLLVAKEEGTKINAGMALDDMGKSTTDPSKAIEGGLLPFGGHKGSGLAFIVELLGGALTGSRVGNNVPGGWGSFYILIDPTLFRPLSDFKRDVQTAIAELKSSPKMKGFHEIYFAGERSYKTRQDNLAMGTIEITEKLYSKLITQT